MKKIIALIALVLSSSALAASSSVFNNEKRVYFDSLGCSDCFNFVAPSVFDASTVDPGEIGQIVYDTNDHKFKGFNTSGQWDELSKPSRETFAASTLGNCTSSPCSIDIETGNWLIAINRSQTGVYSANFEAGVFSEIPVCFCSVKDFNSLAKCSVNGATAGGVVIVVKNSSTGAFLDGNFQIMCVAQ